VRAPKVVSRQLSNPTGFGGRLVRRAMNRGNAGMNEEAVDRLEAAAGDRVLDIGFGGGVTFQLLFKRGIGVAGVDRSPDVISAAEADFSEAIGAGKLELSLGSADSIPFGDDTFEGIVTVNTVYFWPDLDAGMREIHRALKPGGRVVVSIRDGSVMTRVDPSIFTIRPPAELVAAMEGAGLVDVRSDATADAARHHVVARKP